MPGDRRGVVAGRTPTGAASPCHGRPLGGPMAQDATEANFFQLSSDYPQIQVSYTASDIGGQEQVSFEDADGSRSFRGPNEVRSLDTGIGKLVTVTLEAVPDLHTITFSVLLPSVLVEGLGEEAAVTAVGLRTTTSTTIAGPPTGPAQSYETVLLEGTASLVAT